MLKQRRFRHTMNLKERLLAFAREARAKAGRLEPCPEKDDLLRKARQAEITAELDNWANSPGLQPPT